MWSMLQSKISTKNIDALLLRAEKVIGAPDSTEFVSDGKTFFKPYKDEENNLDLLKQIHLDVWPEISQRINFCEPVVDHSYLLLKSPGGVETKMHQDRVYWERKEAEPSIISVWIALEDLTPAKGGLLLSRENEVKSKQWTSFNTGSILNHEKTAETSSVLLRCSSLKPSLKNCCNPWNSFHLGKGKDLPLTALNRICPAQIKPTHRV